MNILALDLGTKTGWAASVNGTTVSGVQNFTPRRFDGGGMRFLRFREWLSELLGKHKFNLVCFEEVRRHLGTDAAHVYGGLMGQLTSICEEMSIPYEGVAVGTIKAFACGKGNASKSEMIATCVALGHGPADDNEADAIHLLRYAIENHKSCNKISGADEDHHSPSAPSTTAFV